MCVCVCVCVYFLELLSFFPSKLNSFSDEDNLIAKYFKPSFRTCLIFSILIYIYIYIYNLRNQM